MKIFLNHIFAYYDSPLPIGSDEIIKRLQMWLNNPQSGHKEVLKFPIFGEIGFRASPPIYIHNQTHGWFIIKLLYHIIKISSLAKETD